MNLDEGLFDHLTTHPGLAALIGTRLHPDYFSEDEELAPRSLTRSRTTARCRRSRGRPHCARPPTGSTSGGHGGPRPWLS